jgi:hypothetical protein
MGLEKRSKFRFRLHWSLYYLKMRLLSHPKTTGKLWGLLGILPKDIEGKFNTLPRKGKKNAAGPGAHLKHQPHEGNQ